MMHVKIVTCYLGNEKKSKKKIEQETWKELKHGSINRYVSNTLGVRMYRN